ncbi:ABC transporter ATP-binding protein [Bacillus sp. RO1]|uniref:ABC transporter ATP-binding protein n=1 Tax=Bacillus sp. RO1 TaxID=2722703 RepID=UPI0014576560|nr:ABC transporter ATP-binding protein [Bacillus sp. RO1]NLP52506.1 ABC transporter ATP-binding protein [Bacillus sp. RO1]
MNSLIKTKDLRVHFDLQTGFLKGLLSKEKKRVKAVDGIDIDINKGEILSLVGESGSGKTTTGKAILQLLENVEGDITYDGKPILQKDKKQIQAFRQKAQMIFQDPYESLNSKFLIIDIVAEPLEINGLIKNEQQKKEKVKEALEWAGLRPAEQYLYRYPHELSGGQRQRVVIAAALILNPEFIVADEPVSMLDVSVRADILRLMVNLRDEKGISYLFITHDISLAWLISDRIAIMYLGKIVEIGDVDKVISASLHPYTKALINVMPKPTVAGEKRKRMILKGETPNPSNVPSGCRFHTRCPFAEQKCKVEEPPLVEYSENHFAACHFAEELN